MATTQTEKQCSKCKLSKPFSEFRKDKHNRSTGLESQCKDCRKLYRVQNKIKNQHVHDDGQARFKCSVCKEMKPRSKMVEDLGKAGGVDNRCYDCNRKRCKAAAASASAAATVKASSPPDLQDDHMSCDELTSRGSKRRCAPVIIPHFPVATSSCPVSPHSRELPQQTPRSAPVTNVELPIHALKLPQGHAQPDWPGVAHGPVLASSHPTPQLTPNLRHDLEQDPDPFYQLMQLLPGNGAAAPHTSIPGYASWATPTYAPAEVCVPSLPSNDYLHARHAATSDYSARLAALAGGTASYDGQAGPRGAANLAGGHSLHDLFSAIYPSLPGLHDFTSAGFSLEGGARDIAGVLQQAEHPTAAPVAATAHLGHQPPPADAAISLEVPPMEREDSFQLNSLIDEIWQHNLEQPRLDTCFSQPHLHYSPFECATAAQPAVQPAGPSHGRTLSQPQDFTTVSAHLRSPFMSLPLQLDTSTQPTPDELSAAPATQLAVTLLSASFKGLMGDLPNMNPHVHTGPQLAPLADPEPVLLQEFPSLDETSQASWE